MEEADQKFDDVAWTAVMAQVEKTYVLLTEQQIELENQNKSLTNTQKFLSNTFLKCWCKWGRTSNLDSL